MGFSLAIWCGMCNQKCAEIVKVTAVSSCTEMNALFSQSFTLYQLILNTVSFNKPRIFQEKKNVWDDKNTPQPKSVPFKD